MQALKSQQIRKLRKPLKKHIKNNIADIFLIGSALKEKLVPKDLDVIVLFKNKNLRQVEENLFAIKESLTDVKEAHIESLFVGSMFNETIFLTILHEGFSIKNGRKISEMLNIKSFSIFSYGLENLSKIDKVRFAQALYGRKKDGLLFQEKGISLGQGSFMVDVKKEEIFKEFFRAWKVKYEYKRAFVSD